MTKSLDDFSWQNNVHPRLLLQALDKFAEDHPAMPLGPALEVVLAEQAAKPQHQIHTQTYKQAAQWCLEQKAFMEFLYDKKPINAIKQLRVLTYMGLKEAKYLTEYVRYAYVSDTVPAHWIQDEWDNLIVGTYPHVQQVQSTITQNQIF